MTKRVLAVPKNTVVTCPKCDQFIALAKHDLYNGDSLLAEAFEFPVHKYNNGDMMICFKCGKWWYDAKNGRIHTSKGWMPDGQDANPHK